MMLNTPTYFTDSDSRESRRELTSNSSHLDIGLIDREKHDSIVS